MEAWQSDFDHIKWLNSLGINSFSGLRLLDLGCGSGFLCEKAMAEGAEAAVGVDIETPKNLEQGQKKENWSFLKVNLDEAQWERYLPLGARFDLVLAFDIIEHLKSPYEFLSSCKRVMAEDGQIILTTPNLDSWERFAHPLSWSGVNDPQHKTLFNLYSLKFLLSRSGFKTQLAKAPMRSLSFLGAMQPNIGGQILCNAKI